MKVYFPTIDELACNNGHSRTALLKAFGQRNGELVVEPLIQRWALHVEILLHFRHYGIERDILGIYPLSWEVSG